MDSGRTMTGTVSELPEELSAPLLSLVALTGLDVVFNAVHKAIWDLLSNNRQPDRVPIQFQVLEGDHEYPRPKPKRSSYEWYVPKGLLKVNWMEKHLRRIPALVVIFFDLDWDEIAWNERLVELGAKVQVVRSALEGRNTRVAVVLIQRNSPLPPGEDVIASERATALCTACNLAAKMLFVLPHTDHLFGYIIRLESAFYELTQNYYQHQCKVVKAHREFLSKTTHQLLFVRHQFKIAFYNELKQDLSTALKHYKQAYANLLEVRASDTNMAEVKMVAGFINYKICRLSFKLNTPLDSISHFRKHIDIFKHRVGSLELAFEHSAWMSKQFSAFGDLFEDAIKSGLLAIQTQHPGFYYQQASLHAITRKKLCRRICQNVFDPPSNPLSGSDSLEYFGQRAWRPGVQSIDPPDHQLEKDGIKALQYREATKINYTNLIIPLLNSAIAQFKKYRCPRMKRHLVVQMGEEYFDANEYGKALAHVSFDYRVEKWFALLTNIFRMAIKCAFLTANVTEYITICLQLISPGMNMSHEEKERMQRNLIAVIGDQDPDPESDLDPVSLESAKGLWESSKGKFDVDDRIITMEISDIVTSFMSCRVVFLEKSVCVDKVVNLNISLDVSCPLPIRFAKLYVHFSNPRYNDGCVVTDSNISGSSSSRSKYGAFVVDLLLEPGVQKNIPLTFVPSPNDINQDIHITSLALQLGNDKGEEGRCVILRWKNEAETSSVHQHRNEFPTSAPSPSGFSAVKILPRESGIHLTVVHESPALLNEFYPINIRIQNEEETSIDDVQLDVRFFSEAISSNASLYADNPSSSLPEKITCLNISLGDLSVRGHLERTIFFQTPEEEEGSCTLAIKVSYGVWLNVGGEDVHLQSSRCHEVTIPVVRPFKISARAMSVKMQSLEMLWTKEPFLLHVDIQSTSPWPLLFKSARFELDSIQMKKEESNSTNVLRDVVLRSGDWASECYHFVAPEVDVGMLSLGRYYLLWKRDGSCQSKEIPFVETGHSLPSLAIIRVPVSLFLELPTHGWARTPLTVQYHFTNTTIQIQEFDFCMDATDAFMYAGHKQVHFKILPEKELVLRYNLYPLVSGFVALPKLRMLTHDPNYDAQIEGVLQKMVPTHIFILPQEKKHSDVEAPLS